MPLILGTNSIKDTGYDVANSLRFDDGSTAPTFTSTDAKTDILVFKYNGAVWQEVGRTLNLSES